ncbi:MAG: hypothetical protein HY326_04780 [Chloroflexi bacterium]|nr:hypothetical protein [Chloroflexota bacterium]
MAEFIKFTTHLISSEFNYAYGTSIIDLTGNGHLDIRSAPSHRTSFLTGNSVTPKTDTSDLIQS